jgi:Glycosyl transferases group 1
MNLVVFSHKLCRQSENSPTGYVTDGGFPLQMQAISMLFSRTKVVVPCQLDGDNNGLSPLVGNNMSVVPLSVPAGENFRRKISLPKWLLQNGRTILREVRGSDAVHTPIPGDIGTIGMILALLFRKPLFVRHCGNWMVQRTVAERFWKWAMEWFAGGRNVMFATGGAAEPPSGINKNIRWIFSTSLTSRQIAESKPRTRSGNEPLRLIIACRQEEKKGTGIVINSLPLILKDFPETVLDVVGGGSLLPELKYLAESLGVAEKVNFYGKVVQSRVPELMRQADMFCYPTTASEGFPKVVLEALANGLPVITTNVSVLPHLVGSHCGVILDRVSPSLLAEAVLRVGSDSAIYQGMSEKAIGVAAKYTLEKWSELIGEELRRSWGIPSLNRRNVNTEAN